MTFVETKLWSWSDAESSCEAPSQTPWTRCHELGRQTMQVISNGGLLCSGNKGSCRQSFDALVRRRSHSAISSWPSLSNALKGSRFTAWLAPVPMRLTHRTVQVISNGDLLCFQNKGSCRRSFDASSQHVWLSVSIQVCLVLNTRSRPSPKSGVGCRLTTLLLLLQCQVSHGVRVPALSVGAGEGNFLAYPRRLQVPKLNGEQVTDGKQEPTHQWNRCVKRSFVRACNRAIRHGQAQPLYLCTSRFLQIPEECVAADHRCLVPDADRKPAAATHPILGWDGPHWVPTPRKLRDVVWILATPLQVAVSKCEKAVFRRCSAARPSWGTELHGSQCAFQRPLAVHRITGC